VWGISYIGSCTYLTQIAADVVTDNGSCNDLGDGMVLLFSAGAIAGIAYFLVVCIGIEGSKAFKSENYLENLQEGDKSYPPQQVVPMDEMPADAEAAPPPAPTPPTVVQPTG